jgi:hypothetical protein
MASAPAELLQRKKKSNFVPALSNFSIQYNLQAAGSALCAGHLYYLLAPRRSV